jgi:Glycosyltransferase
MSISITFISNSLTIHQKPISDALYYLLGDNYRFISNYPLSEERKGMGWTEIDKPYEIKAFKSSAIFEEAHKLANESDIVIIGSAPDSFIEKRLKNKKITFKYSERLYKKSLSFINFPRALYSSFIHHGRFQKYPLFMLSASAYTAADLAIFKNYINRTFKWGYYPETKEFDINQLIRNKRGAVVNVLWVGRFLVWKHPEYALLIAKNLVEANINFNLKMIGNGPELDNIKKFAGKLNLTSVEFLGAMESENVRKYMEDANIFLITSDFNEGWGAVLNEAMNSGCAVITSHAVGAAPFLIQHGNNGLIYKNGDLEDLCNKVKRLATDYEFREKLGKNAYFTIQNTWNADVAAKRILNLSQCLLEGKVFEYDDGPCSRAEIIKNNWFTGLGNDAVGI